MSTDLNNPTAAAHFSSFNSIWRLCKVNKYTVHGEILQFYESVGGAGLYGLADLSLPKSGEIPLDAIGNVMQIYKRGILYYDPDHKFDNSLGTGRFYKAHESKQAAPKYYRAK